MTETAHSLRVEPSRRRVRVVLNGVTVADSTRPLLAWPVFLPVYYFPREDVQMDLLAPTGERVEGQAGFTTRFSVRAGDREARNAAWTQDEVPALAGHVAFEWGAMDAWYEEDDEVYVHARDPHHRVDVLRSSRHVRVEVLGETVAETRRPSLLFETGLPTRYYIPRADVRMDALVPSDTTTQCPYKGVATYYSVRVGDRLVRDLVWTYRYPIQECARIENMLCFFNEQVDAIVVDGETEEKPRTPWTRPPRIEQL